MVRSRRSVSLEVCAMRLPVAVRRGGWRTLALASVVVMLGVGGVAWVAARAWSEHPAGTRELEGRDEREPVSHKPTVEAACAAESYRAGERAHVVLFDAANDLTVQLFRVGDARGLLRARDVMRGRPLEPRRWIGRVSAGTTIDLPLRATWPGGLYFVRLAASGQRIGYAPFVLAPRRLGMHRVAVVLPTQTWQAYNFRDDDGDGTGDTWYASASRDTARLYRPFENRGVPPHYHYYDEPFLRWLDHDRYRVDFLSDAELRTVGAAALSRAYALLIFSGHHEYVTSHEYDVVTRFRDRGGSLMFLSANNFFYKITISGNVMTRVGQWRNLGRHEASLVGVEYFGYDSAGRGGSPWTVRKAPASGWIFRGTHLGPGSALSSGGIEADRTCSESPRGIQVIAEIENVFGRGQSAQMTYYETPTGARVFAAGAFSLACSIWQPPVRRVVANLIAELTLASRE